MSSRLAVEAAWYLRHSLPIVDDCVFRGTGACGGGGSAPTTQPPPATDSLTQADVQMLVQAAAMAADADSMAIAVVDRLGRILAVYKGPSAPATLPSNFGAMVPSDELAVSLARTGAFFSNDQAPLSSRTCALSAACTFRRESRIRRVRRYMASRIQIADAISRRA